MSEVIKSVLVKALLQIDRSRATHDRSIIAECAYFLNIEAIAARENGMRMKNESRRLLSLL